MIQNYKFSSVELIFADKTCFICKILFVCGKVFLFLPGCLNLYRQVSSITVPFFSGKYICKSGTLSSPIMVRSEVRGRTSREGPLRKNAEHIPRDLCITDTWIEIKVLKAYKHSSLHQICFILSKHVINPPQN